MYYPNYGAPYMPQMARSYNDFNIQAQQSVNNGNSITWVQGEVGAKSFQLPPNSNVLLMDSEDTKFYIKSTDSVGMATLRRFTFTEILNEQPNTQQSSQINVQDFVTRDEFNKLLSKISMYENILTGGNKNESTDNSNG